METFLSIEKDYIEKNEILEKKSRFLAFAFYVETSEEAEVFLRKLKMEYKDAKHIVFAYRLLSTSRFSDDGEPSGTAGKPILDILEKEGIFNIIVCVVRYFGGVKLGAGPLLRVYANSAKSVLNNLRIYEKCNKTDLCLTFSEFEKLLKRALKENIKLSNTVFGENVTLTAVYPKNVKINLGKATKNEEIYHSFKVKNDDDNKDK